MEGAQAFTSLDVALNNCGGSCLHPALSIKSNANPYVWFGDEMGQTEPSLFRWMQYLIGLDFEMP
jgi:hypothetical protein